MVTSTKVTITMDSQDHQLVKSAASCYLDWLQERADNAHLSPKERAAAREEHKAMTKVKGSL